jgi:hypothetical protein
VEYPRFFHEDVTNLDKKCSDNRAMESFTDFMKVVQTIPVDGSASS